MYDNGKSELWRQARRHYVLRLALKINDLCFLLRNSDIENGEHAADCRLAYDAENVLAFENGGTRADELVGDFYEGFYKARIARAEPEEEAPAVVHLEEEEEAARDERASLAKAAAEEALRLAWQESKARIIETDELRDRTIQLLSELDCEGLKNLLVNTP